MGSFGIKSVESIGSAIAVLDMCQANSHTDEEKDKTAIFDMRPASWSSGQSLWLLIMRSRVRFPALQWEFSLKGKIPTVTMVWAD